MKYLLTIIAILLFFAIHSNASASTIVRSPNNTGLVGYWNFDVQAGGTNVVDLSGNGNNGTMTNMDPATDWVDGKVGSGALDFDGSNDYINAGDITALNGTSAFTISGWAKQTTLDQARWIYSKSTVSCTTTCTLMETYVDGNLYVEVRNGASSYGYLDYSLYVTAGNWFHYAVVFDGSQSGNNANALKLYIDGVNRTLAYGGTIPATTANLTARNFTIGQSDFGSFSTWNGQMDEVRVYNRALSASEIQRLYKATAGTKIAKPALSSGLVGYWNFDVQAGGSTVYDLSGNANNGTMTGMDPATDWVDGKVGSGALDFDGSNDYVDMGNSANFNLTTTFTLSAWINPSALSGYQVLIAKGTAGAYNYQFYLNGAGPGRLSYHDDNNGEKISTYIPTASTWTYVTAVVNGISLKLYANGIKIYDTTLAFVPLTNSNILAIGRGGAYASNYFGGRMDEARIYNRALSADEIRRLYNLGK